MSEAWDNTCFGGLREVGETGNQPHEGANHHGEVQVRMGCQEFLIPSYSGGTDKGHDPRKLPSDEKRRNPLLP